MAFFKGKIGKKVKKKSKILRLQNFLFGSQNQTLLCIDKILFGYIYVSEYNIMYNSSTKTIIHFLIILLTSLPNLLFTFYYSKAIHELKYKGYFWEFWQKFKIEEIWKNAKKNFNNNNVVHEEELVLKWRFHKNNSISIIIFQVSINEQKFASLCFSKPNFLGNV